MNDDWVAEHNRTAHSAPTPPLNPADARHADQMERLIAALDAMDGPELRKFLRRLSDRYGHG